VRKLVFALAVTLTTALYSCDKKPSTPVVPTVTNSTEFNINGISDIKIPSNGGGELVLSIQLISGTQENVTLAISGVPAKVSADFSTTSGIPTYASILSFTSNDEAVGTYPLTITATSVSGVKKEFKFNLVIEKPEDCATPIIGNYTGTVKCDASSPSSTTANIVAGPDLNTIKIIGQGTSEAIADLDCTNGTLVIREKIQDNTTYSIKITGSGTFVSPGILNFTVKNVYYVGGVEQYTSECTFSLTK